MLIKRIKNNAGVVTLTVGALVGIILLAGVVGGVVTWLFGGGGFGFGGGTGDGEGEGETAEAVVTVDAKIEVEEIEYIDITVSGSKYIYQNREISLDNLISELKSIDDIKTLKITDDGASLKAYNRLKKSFDENGFSYIEESTANNEKEVEMV